MNFQLLNSVSILKGILRGRLLQVTEENKTLSGHIAELQSVTRTPSVVPSTSTEDRSEIGEFNYYYYYYYIGKQVQ